MAAAVLHPQQFVLALVEFVIADGGNIQPHHRQRLDGRLVMEHRRQERAGADQIAGGDEDRVLVPVAELLDQRRHMLGAAGGDDDLFGLVGGIGDPDAARRRAQIAVKIVDREDAQIDGRRFGRARRGRKRQRERERKDRTKRIFMALTYAGRSRRFPVIARQRSATSANPRLSFDARATGLPR